MKKRIILILFICAAFTGNAQTGYLGNLNAVEFKIGLTPTQYRKNKIVNLTQNEDYLHSTLRLALPSFQLNYARTLMRKIEVSAGFDFGLMNLISGNVRFDTETNYTMLQNLKVVKFGGNFEFRYYRKGSFSPIGKYVGFAINFGRSSVQTNNGLIYGTAGNTASNSNFITRKRNITYADTTFNLTGAKSVNSGLRIVIGRNYPLGHGLTLNVGMSAPIFSHYTSELGGVNGFFFWNTSEFRIINGELERSLQHTIHKYNRIILNVSIKKYF